MISTSSRNDGRGWINKTYSRSFILSATLGGGAGPISSSSLISISAVALVAAATAVSSPAVPARASTHSSSSSSPAADFSAWASDLLRLLSRSFPLPFSLRRRLRSSSLSLSDSESDDRWRRLCLRRLVLRSECLSSRRWLRPCFLCFLRRLSSSESSSESSETVAERERLFFLDEDLCLWGDLVKEGVSPAQKTSESKPKHTIYE